MKKVIAQMTKKGKGKTKGRKKLPSDYFPLLKPISALGQLVGLPKFREVKENLSTAPVAMSHLQKYAGSSRTIRDSELVGSLNGSVGFSLLTWTLNPGSSRTFPRLSISARSFQSYRFSYLRFRFETTSPTSSKGQIILVPEYTVKDAALASEQQACNAQGATSNACWTSFSCTLSPLSMFSTGTRKLIRLGLNGIEGTVCDAGRFSVATTGMADNSTIGRLWVDYEVELYVSQVPDTYVHTAITQSLHLANVVVLNDGIEHTLSWTSDTSSMYSVPSGTDLPLMQGIYVVEGYLAMSNDAKAATVELIPYLNNTANFPPYNAPQHLVTNVDATLLDHNFVVVPFSFVIRVDTDGYGFKLNVRRLDGDGMVDVISPNSHLKISPS